MSIFSSDFFQRVKMLSSRSLRLIPPAISDTARVIFPPLTVFASLVLLLGMWAWWFPPRATPKVHDSVIVNAQIERAKDMAVLNPDVVFVGDSSCLMGMVQSKVEELLNGPKLQSLCTIGYAGPVGAGKLLRIMTESGARPKAVIALFNEISLNSNEGWSSWEDFIDQYDTSLSKLSILNGAQEISRSLVRPILDFPLYGSYATRYGSPMQLTNWISAHNGSMVESSAPPSYLSNFGTPTGGAEYKLSEKFLKDLEFLQFAMRETGAQIMMFGFTPTPENLHGENSELIRDKALERALNAMGEDVDEFPMPWSLEDKLFVSEAHLEPLGRSVLEKHVAETLTALLGALK